MKRLLTRRLRRWVLVIASCLAIFGGVFLARGIALPDARLLWLLVPFLAISWRQQNLSTLCFLVCARLNVG